MKFRYKVYDFLKWEVKEYEREIDFDEAIKNNALIQLWIKQDEEKKAKQGRQASK
jgi:hypothetical protein